MRALNTRQATPGDAVLEGPGRVVLHPSQYLGWIERIWRQVKYELWICALISRWNFCFHELSFLITLSFPLPSLPPSLPSFSLFLFCCVLTLYQALPRLHLIYSPWLHSKKNMILILQMKTLRLRGVDASNHIVTCRTWIWIRSDLTTQALIHSINRSKFVY